MTAAGAPSQAYFALAIVLLKLKPRGVTFEGFILSLRQSLTREADQPASLTKPVLNVAAFWQNIFIQSQQQNQKQESQIIALQNQLDDDGSQSQGHEQRWKRKHDNVLSPSKANMQSKKRKLDLPPDMDLHSDEHGVAEPNPDHLRLLRIILRLAPTSHINIEDGVDGKETVQYMRDACVAIIGSIQIADDRSTDAKATKTVGLSLHEACHTAKSIWWLITKCLREQRPTSGNAKLLERLVPALSSVVQFLLGRLHQYCLDEADDRSKLSSRRTGSRKSNTKATIQRSLEATELFKYNCNTISSLLAHMLASTTILQPKCPVAFEAVACTFLDHLGSSISLHLFGDPENNTDSKGLMPPRGPQDVAHIATDDAILTTQLEAPYLVHILRGLTRPPEARNKGGSRHTFTRLISSGASFGANTLERLQNTLLRGIFDDEDMAFANSLRRVETEDALTSLPGTEMNEVDENSRNWFLSQVWENLGWDILFRKQ